MPPRSDRLRRISQRVAKFGGSMRTTIPLTNRLISDSPNSSIIFGWLSLAITTCRPIASMALNVCRNSSCVAFLPPRKCTSSITSRSRSRILRRKTSSLLVRSAERNSLVNSSPVRYSPALGRVVLDELLAQALEQVRLAQPAVAVDEQRVVLRAGELGDVQRGVVGELVARPDDEGLHVVAGAAGRSRDGGRCAGRAAAEPPAPGERCRRRG